MVTYDPVQLDADILNAIRNFNGISDITIISKTMGISRKPVKVRFANNPELSSAMEKANLAYIDGLPVDQLTTYAVGMLSKCHHLPVLLARIRERVDTELILPAIESCHGVPSPTSLSHILPFSKIFIMNRFKENKLLAEKADEVGLKYINALPITELGKCVSSYGGSLTISVSSRSKLLERIYQRLDDELILPTIGTFVGIPTRIAIAKALRYSNKIIQDRFSENPLLLAEADRVGLEYVNSLNLDQLITTAAQQGGLIAVVNYLPKTRARAYERIDIEIILPTIKYFKGTPTPTAIASLLPFSQHFVPVRIYSNPVLFAAMAAKQGLSIDQAVELALGRNDDSAAVDSLVAGQLKNLYAFREMLGVFRVFSDLIEKAKHILEVSLYPAPLGKAMELDGAQAITVYAHPKRDIATINTIEGRYDLVVLQGIHRLSQGEFNSVLVELRKSLPPGTPVLATFSKEYAIPDDMPAALKQAGFELKDSGILEVTAPEDLSAYTDDSARIRRKIAGYSNLLHLMTTEHAETVQVPVLVKISEGITDIQTRRPSGESIDLPEETLRDMRTTFVPNIELVHLPDKPMMTIVTDESDRQLVVVGYDMSLQKPKRVEVDKYPRSRGIDFDFRSFARNLARDATLRANLGVTPGSESRVKFSKLVA